MSHIETSENCASGKTIFYKHDSVTGKLDCVRHCYGYEHQPPVSIVIYYLNGRVVHEFYLVGGKPVTAKKYLEVIQNYSDMPLPSQEGAKAKKELDKTLKEEKARWLAQFDAHIADPI